MNYREIIESRYNRKNWQELLFDIFRNKAQFWQQPQRVPVDESMAKSAYYTGKITLPDGHTIAIYEVELSDNVIIERNRAGIRNLLCTNWRGMGCSGAFMFCFRQQEAVLRFSYVSEAFTFAEDGSLKKDSTDTKRFTYLLGEGHRSRTAIQQFEKLKASGLTLKDITKAFSVEALSDLFFKEYKKQYEDIIEFVTGKRMVKVANKWEERVTGEPCREIMQEFAQFPDAEKAVRDYVKKLMGRLVFIQFLQKKGWMGCSAGEAWNDGDREFVQNLFANTTRKNTFIDEVLEPLFNDINTKRKNDLASDWSNSYLLPYGGRSGGGLIKVPYLNGGLFEHDDYDKTNFPLPAKYMKSLLDFFASYNFTIDENDPDDAEIGVDPEMLGRIFENLLEDNKDKGAFYTPKEIVQYMCRESLIAYLQTDEEDEAVKLQIREFVTTNNADLLSADLAASIDQKLKDVKICDPAIGSGAFPMGLLRELYACRKAIEGIDNDNAVRIKTHIIQNNIYGVDIEKGAVDIARLRFWLALIVDEKTPHALPNMDFKIMQGNSLLEQYEGVELSGMSLNEQEKKRSRQKKEQAWQQTLAFDEEASLDNIQNAIREYYGTDDHRQKTELRNIINSNVKSYILNLKGCTPDIQRKLENLPIPNDQFFLWHIYFKEVFDKGGFDIVIGNPPYISAVTMARSEEEKLLYRKQYPEAKGAYDMYILFLLLGANMSKSTYCWIIPNKLLVADYGKKCLERLISEEGLSKSVDVSIYDVFKTASVYPIIILGNKQQREGFGKYYLSHYADLLSNKLIKKEDVSDSIIKLEDLGVKVCSGATGFEAQKIKDNVMNEVVPNSIPFTVSGNVDRYTFNNHGVRYMKSRYEDAHVILDEKISYGKQQMWNNPKIVVAGMTKCIEAVYADEPLGIGVGAYAIYDFNGIDPYYLLGVLNAKITTQLLIKEFSDKHLAGGYLAINKSTIEQFRFPNCTDKQIQEEIASKAKKISIMKKENLLADTSSIEDEIDNLVESLYKI